MKSKISRCTLTEIYNKKDDLTESCREEIREIIQKNLIKRDGI